jgi:hypothetical protein
VGTRNKLNDLNNHLFEQLERLNDDELNGDDLKLEIDRSKAITQIASNIIQNGYLALKALKHFDDYGYGMQREVPDILKLAAGGRKNEER